MNIFIARLNFSTTSDSLRELFEEFGEVSSANVIMDKNTGKSKGYGFVEMSNDDEAQRAIDELDQCEFDERTIVVKKANPREERPRNNRRFDRDDRY
ncbi:MAG: RNA recognition motif domain-containing protein [Chlorobiota bacterium]